MYRDRFSFRSKHIWGQSLWNNRCDQKRRRWSRYGNQRRCLEIKTIQKVQADIEAVVEAAKDKALVKVIIETALLDNEEIVKACELAKAAGADFVKTSTGFSTGGAVVEDVRLMRETVGPEMGVKASGGIHNEAEAAAMVEAGANRLGTSASVAIVTGSTGAGY